MDGEEVIKEIIREKFPELKDMTFYNERAHHSRLKIDPY